MTKIFVFYIKNSVCMGGIFLSALKLTLSFRDKNYEKIFSE